MKLTTEEFAYTVRSLKATRGEALAYLTRRILTLEGTKPNSARLPELRAAHREIERNRQKYD